jgi:pimeloyl-ACP methyl ester carboxylesterase
MELRDAFFQVGDGTRLAYEDYGAGVPMVFVSGWVLNADMWEYQVPFFVERGFRCVLLDRRGHGRSDRPSSGYDVNTRADDLAALIEHLDLRNAILVTHSAGGGEAARYLSRHGEERVSGVVFLGATLPYLRLARTIPKEFLRPLTKRRWRSSARTGQSGSPIGPMVISPRIWAMTSRRR